MFLINNMQSLDNGNINSISNSLLIAILILKMNENLLLEQYKNHINSNLYGNYILKNYPSNNFNSNKNLNPFLSYNFYQNNFNSIKGNINSNSKISSKTTESQNKKKEKKKIKKYKIMKNHEKKGKEEIDIKNKIINVKSENIINISLILSGKEKRTFVRFHPIPKRLSVHDMVKIIDKYLKTEPGKRIYNAVYLPLTKRIGKNMGYFFINLVSPKYVVIFYNIFNGFYLRYKNMEKQCTVIFANNQKIDISNEDPSRKPFVFTDTIKI